MTDYLQSSVNLIRDNIGKILVVLGIGFLVLGALFLSQISSAEFWIVAVGVCIGIMLTSIGFLIEVDFYSSSSLTGKLGAVLATTSAALFSIASLSITYRVVTGIRQGASNFRGMIEPFLTVTTANPYAWLFFPFLTAGVCLLITGVILRINAE